MGARIKKLKKIRIHREGTNELFLSALAIIAITLGLHYLVGSIWAVLPVTVVLTAAWVMALNFYRCPIRYFNGDTEKLVVAPADGKIVVVEEAEENEYFHDKRLMISIFMSPLNVHANWFPIDGKIKFVKHFDGYNDGLVGEESFQWGPNYQFLTNRGLRGISHADMIDLNRENIDGFDIREFYVSLVQGLKERGL